MIVLIKSTEEDVRDATLFLFVDILYFVTTIFLMPQPRNDITTLASYDQHEMGNFNLVITLLLASAILWQREIVFLVATIDQLGIKTKGVTSISGIKQSRKRKEYNYENYI